MSNVPMSHPATANKNSDGTYTVRIQHTTEGSVTNVDFTNVLFAATLANAYADMLNGKAALEAKVGELVSEAKPAVADATADVKRLLAEAEVEAGKLIAAARSEGSSLLTDAKTEANKLKSDAQALYEETKNEAEKLLEEARAEASKLLKAVSEKVAPAEEPAPAPAAKTVEEE